MAGRSPTKTSWSPAAVLPLHPTTELGLDTSRWARPTGIPVQCGSGRGCVSRARRDLGVWPFPLRIPTITAAAGRENLPHTLATFLGSCFLLRPRTLQTARTPTPKKETPGKGALFRLLLFSDCCHNTDPHVPSLRSVCLHSPASGIWSGGSELHKYKRCVISGRHIPP